MEGKSSVCQRRKKAREDQVRFRSIPRSIDMNDLSGDPKDNKEIEKEGLKFKS